MKAIVINSILISIIILLLCPIAGYLINSLVTKIISRICRLFDRTGNLYLVFANVITFLGVIHHELAHAFFAAILGAKVRNIRLYHLGGGSLGSVTYTPRGPLLLRSVQMAMSSAAPVFVGAITEFLLFSLITNSHLPMVLLIFIVFLMISIVIHMDMSLADILIYLKGVPCCFLILFVVFVVLLSTYDIPWLMIIK